LQIKGKDVDLKLHARPLFISIVDDELDLGMLFKDILSTITGVQSLCFSDAKLALEHFGMNNGNYLLVISDYRMPGMNGIELLTKIRELDSNVRTILMSAFEVTEDMFLDCKCVDKMLQKPIHTSKFCQKSIFY
jgi:DNA-binding response OmpR family regulator